MNNFVKEKEEFNTHKLRLFSLINEDLRFESNPFKSHFNEFISIEFDMIFSKNFFDGFRKFASFYKLPNFVLYVIDPDPETYFYYHFKKYNVIVVESSSPYDEFSGITAADPGDSPADAIDTNSNEIAIFSRDDKWVMVGSRSWEIMIVGFANTEVKHTFIQSFADANLYLFTSLKEHVDELDSMLRFSQKARRAYDALIERYKRR